MTSSRASLVVLAAGLLIGLPAVPAAHALDARQWQAVAPALQAAIECRAAPDTDAPAWKALGPAEGGSLGPFQPPAPFTVFGLPVREVTVYIDPDGEMGASYSASFAATRAQLRSAAKLDAKAQRQSNMGSLGFSDDSSASLTCTVAGSYDESDYQE